MGKSRRRTLRTDLDTATQHQDPPETPGGAVRPGARPPTPVPEQWPSAEEVRAAFDTEAAFADLLEKLTPELLIDQFKRLPSSLQQWVLHDLNLHNSRHFNRGMAGALLARMRREGPGGHIVDRLCSLLVDGLRLAEGTAEEWAAFFAGHDDLVRMPSPDPDAPAGEYFPLNSFLGYCVPLYTTELADLALVVAVHTSHSPVPALTALAGTHPAAADALTDLATQHPDLPAAPTQHLWDLAVEHHWREHHPDEYDTEAEEPAPFPGTGGDPADLIALLDWAEAAQAAGRVAASLTSHAAPDEADLDHLLDFTDAVHDVAAVLAGRLGREVTASRTAFEEAIRDLHGGAERELLTRLCHLTGPAHFDVAIRTVRDLAEVALSTDTDPETADALVALARLAEACTARKDGVDVDLSEVAVWDAAARGALPDAAQPALTAALMGDLTLPDTHTHEQRADTAPAVPAPRTDPAPELPGRGDATVETAGNLPEAPAADTEPADTEPADTDATGNDGDDESEDDATTPTDTGAEVPAAAPETATGAEPRAEPAAEPAAADPDPTTEPTAAPAVEPAPTLADLRAAALADLSSPKARSLRIPDSEPDRRPQPPAAEEVPHADEESAEEEDDTDEHGRLHEIDALLLRQQRFGLASHLHQAPAHRAARQMAAWQQHLTAPAGDLAAAFAGAATHINRDALSDDRAGQLLAWAAAVRVSTLAPAVGSAAVLGNLAPCVQAVPALVAVGEAFTRAALAGVIAVPALSELDEAETAAAEMAAAAADTVAAAPRMTIKYIPANGVYQAWMDPKGLLGGLLRRVAANDAGHIAEVLATVTGLRGDAERHIDETFVAQRRRNRKDRIIAGARGSLIGLYNDALDVAAAWAEHAAAAQEHRDRIRHEQRAARPLEALRRELAPLRDPALAALRHLADDAPDPDDVEAAAYQAVALMLTAAFDTVDGRPPAGPEPSPTWVLNHEFLGTDLPLDPDTLLPLTGEDGPGDVFAVVESLAAAGFDADRVYALRAARRQHQLTLPLVENLAAVDPQLGATLRERRARDVGAAADQLSARVEDVESLIRLRQRDATLPAEVAATLTAQAAAVAHSPSRDFPALHATLDAVTDQVNLHRDEQVAAARARLETTAAANPRVAEHRQLLVDLIDTGEVAVALEYLEQLTTHGRLPEPHDEGIQFARFFPAVPELAADHPTLLVDLHKALSGQAPTGPVQALCAAASTTLADLPDAAKQTAARAVGAWAALATPKGQRTDVKSALRAVLAVAGFEFADLAGAPRTVAGQPGRTWLKLAGVTAVGRALSPILGSQMSKDAATLRVLLVTKPTAPATLLEWAGKERPEDTIVVLHLPSSYSPADRRALANASRGRPRPPVVVLDPAVLAFLAVQPEPSRSTLAALTLPFTGDSPYRDRAGRTAPEMFYGRASERREVLDLEGPSFVSGGRQLGKSALLWSARDEFDDGHARRAVLAEIRVVGGAGDPEQVWPRVLAALVEGGVLREPAAGAPVGAEAVTGAIRSWLDEDPERRLLILLDEADLFLEADAAALFPNIGAAKNLMDACDRRVKFVFAGLHRTARFESLANQPLAHLGRPIVVGPLRPQAAYDLLTRPLTALGYQFADPRTQPARVLAFTNNVPSLLQLFGQALVRRLASRNVEAGPPTVITDDDITAVMDDTNLQTAFRDKYLLTLHLDHRYLVIVYAVAHEALVEGADAGVTLGELEELCHSWWPEGFAEVNIDHLRGLAVECCDLGVLAYDAGRYRMRTQTMLQLLGTTDLIEETLYAAADRLRVPSDSDALSHRVPMTGTTHPGPLTGRQVADLFSRTPRCLLLAGSAGVGVGWVAASLDQMKHAHLTRDMGVRKLVNLTAEGLRGQMAKLTTPGVLVADMRGAAPAKVAALAARARELVAEPGCVTSVVVVADHHSAPAWAGSEDLVELRRLDAPGIRLWCEETGSRFHTPEDYAALLATTSGWPRLVTATAEKDSGMAPPARVLDQIRGDLATPARAAALVGDAGLEGDDPISALLRTVFVEVADLTGEDTAPLDVLAELVADIDGDGGTLAEVAAALGFDRIEDTLVALRASGAFNTDARGHLVPDPVLLAALRTVGAGR